MIPAAFDYVRPRSVDDAVAALAAAGEDAKVLGGGQSLLPVLRLRLNAPTALIDVSALEELRTVSMDGNTLVIGAGVTTHDVMHDDLVTTHAPLIAMAARTVADPAIRHRGTFGGSVAHADPAGDLPTVALALDAEMVLAGPNGRRSVGAKEFFVDYFTTALEADEILVEVRIPSMADGWGFDYQKFHRTAQSWAIVGVAAAVRLDGDTIAEARIALTNMGPTPIRAASVEAALAGSECSAETIAAAADSAADGTRPTTDQHADPDYRQHLARVLTKRAVSAAAGLDS